MSVLATVTTCIAAGIGSPVSGTVQAQLTSQTLEKRVPGNFVGMSIETTEIIPYIGINGSSLSYAQALRNLKFSNGSGPILRIGGSTADFTCYSGGEIPACTHNVTDEELIAYMKFANGPANDLNIKYVIDIDFGLVSDPETVARRQVETLTRLNMWDYIHQVEFGNEVDNYARHGTHRNTSYSFQDYMIDYNTFITSLTREGGIPNSTISNKPIIRGAVYAGPKNDWADGMEQYVEAYIGSIDSISLHQYPVSFCNKNPNQTVLGWGESQGAVNKYAGFFDIFKKHNLTFVIGEGNSASCGGIPGVSDTFQAALWVMDYLPYLSKTGAEGMNFHGSPSAMYTAIAYSDSGELNIQPLYYGLLAFAELTRNTPKWIVVNKTQSVTEDLSCSTGVTTGHDGVCCPASCGTCGGTDCEKRGSYCCDQQVRSLNRNCSTSTPPCILQEGGDYLADIHAVQDDDEIRVLLISKFSTQTIPTTVCFNPELMISNGTVFFITAPSYSSKYGEGINYGGQTFDGSTSGLPIGSRVTEPVPIINKNCFIIDMRPFSAAVVSLPY